MRRALAVAALVLCGCDPASNRVLGQQMATARGWSDTDFECIEFIVMHESGWHDDIVGPAGDYGIPQALPGKKMATVAADWRTNPATQIEWMYRYVVARYGSPCGAAAHKRRTGWYAPAVRWAR
jgi:resuscitation-promoting factor RpfB